MNNNSLQDLCSSITPMLLFTSIVLLLITFAVQLPQTLGLASPSRRGGGKPSPSQSKTEREANDATERTVVLLFHKPANVLTSHISEDSRTTVYDEVQSMKGFLGQTDAGNVESFQQATKIQSKLHAIGRLDADTTGLLLLTNDGGLVHHVTNRNASTHTSAADGITKTYEALIMGHHTEDSLAPLWEGVDIGPKYGGMTRPVDRLQILTHPSHKTTLVSVTISEGKNRQVRRMFHALGSGVMKLKRTNVGEHLSLDGVEEGQWRILSDDEIRQALDWKPKDLAQARLAVAAAKSKQFPRNSKRRDGNNRPKSTARRRRS